MAKEFTWRGKSEEEIKKLDLAQFSLLVPARQRRTLKRGFTDFQKKLLKRLEAGENNVKTHCRDLIILPLMVGRTLKIYNGKEYVPVLIASDMIGHYLGEFAHTRKSVSHSAAGIGATRSSKSVSAR
ncbi:30S ribosomal protein S19 [Candidatus Woesearchaeota archaeon]|nr:30S ribosomal protein S19 [Candidatus Woesearchaeota archaeon]